MPPCRYSQAWLPASSWLRGEGKELESSVEVLLASSLRTKRKPQPNCPADILGSLSNNDGKGYENVTQKVKSHCFKLYRFYSISFNLSNVGNLFWSWILNDSTEVQGKKKKVVCLYCVLCSRSPQNVKLAIFTSWSCSDGEEIQLFRERLSEKMCTRQSRKVIWDMINTLFLTL